MDASLIVSTVQYLMENPSSCMLLRNINVTCNIDHRLKQMLENSHTKECSYDNQNVGEFQRKISKKQFVIARELVSVKLLTLKLIESSSINSFLDH